MLKRPRLLCLLVLCVSRAVLSVVLRAWSVRFVGWADWVDCRCSLSFVFLGVARRLEISPCKTRSGLPERSETQAWLWFRVLLARRKRRSKGSVTEKNNSFRTNGVCTRSGSPGGSDGCGPTLCRSRWPCSAPRAHTWHHHRDAGVRARPEETPARLPQPQVCS